MVPQQQASHSTAPSALATTSNSRPVIVGEVLFDCFDDGREVLGGAPFNVAWHLQAFGLQPLLISRVGDDARGERVREAMRRWGMETAGLQRDPHHPTGEVRIAMQGHSHRFEILPEQAYDYLDATATLALLHECPGALLYSGSLIERSPISRDTLRQLRRLPIPRFVDVNLRRPWWQREAVRQILQGVRWAKLNDEELRDLGYSGDTLCAAQRMRAEQNLELLIVTQGEHGALLVEEQAVHQGQPVAVRQLIDTVGAGDAFSAVLILGLLCGWRLDNTLQRALEFAARQCEVRGAIREDQGYYRHTLQQWEVSK